MISSRVARPAAVVMLVLSFAGSVAAHTTSTGLATVSVSGSTLTYRLTVVLSELPEEPRRVFASAADGDPAAAERVAAALRERVSFRVREAPCRPGRAQVQGSRLGDSRLTLWLELRCSSEPISLHIRDTWSDLFGPHYQTLMRLDTPIGPREVAFVPGAREVTVDVGSGGVTGGSGFFLLGVEHILSGYDHLLFLLALLLPGGGLLSLVKIITAFTIAHSITLTLAVLQVVTLPDRLIEAVIALSIAFVAAENLFLDPTVSRRWLVSFGFGLVHGFGFSSALRELGLPRQGLLLSLFGFNAGVEAGQALVIVVCLPLLLLLRRTPWARPAVATCSLAVLAVGLVLFIERAFL
jgi:hypothetical protein